MAQMIMMEMGLMAHHSKFGIDPHLDHSSHNLHLHREMERIGMIEVEDNIIDIILILLHSFSNLLLHRCQRFQYSIQNNALLRMPHSLHFGRNSIPNSGGLHH